MQRLGQSLGACMRVGDVVLLTGEMGAGKSVLTRAAARAMGVDGPVPSPTFTILNIHEGRAMRLYHFDLYRLSDADELYGMGLDEYIPAEDGVSFIEWPQMAQEAMPEDALHVHIAYAEDGAVALDGGMIGVEACTFRNNKIGFSYDTLSYSFSKDGFPDCRIEGNDVGIQFVNLPGAMPLDFFGTVFSGNGTDIDNPIQNPIDLSNAIFE